MKLLTLDAAGTIIDHCWDPAEIARGCAGGLGANIDRVAGRKAYEIAAERKRPALVAAERISDKEGIRRAWLETFRDWLIQLREDESLAPKVLSAFHERTTSRESGIWSLFPDVMEFLDSIPEGITVGIISNWDHTLHRVLANLEIDSRFDFVLASLEFGFEKPDARIFAEAMARADAEPAESLHVGDSHNDDFCGATAAGMHALLIDRDSQPDFSNGRISGLLQVWEAAVCV